MFERILCQLTEYDPEVLESLIELAVEIAREGREGRRGGTLFTLGDENAVLARSRALIRETLLGHSEALGPVNNLNLPWTIKKLAQLGWWVRAESRRNFPFGVPLPRRRGHTSAGGLGSRHNAAANMSPVTNTVVIGVSESSVVRQFCHGQLVGEIVPEFWMMDHAQLRESVTREQVGELTVLTPNLRPASIAK